MTPKEFEADLMAHGYVNDPRPKRKEVRPDPKLIEILAEQTRFAMAVPAGMLIGFLGLLFCFAIN